MNTNTVFRPMAAACLTALCLSACTRTEAPPAAAATAADVAARAGVAPTPPSGGLAAKLCGVLRSKTPELKDMSEVGARTQLVMAIATAFDVDATALGTVSSDIDAVATAGCPEVRAPLLAATRARSLQEAVR